MGLARMGAIRRAMIVQRLGMLLHLPEDEINGLLRRHAPRSRPGARSGAGPSGSRASENLGETPTWTDNPSPISDNDTEKSENSSNSALPDVASDQNGNRIKLERSDYVPKVYTEYIDLTIKNALIAISERLDKLEKQMI